MEKKKLENGVHEIPNDEYHASSGLSRSGLMRFKRSPYHYWYEYESGLYERPTDSSAFQLGDAVHTLVLEPAEYDKRYFVMPKLDRRTKDGKATYELLSVQCIGKAVLTQEIAATAIAMAGMVSQNEVATSLLKDTSIEHSIYFTHQSTGIQLKARPDAWNGSMVIDLKTSADASYRGFQNSAYKYGYYLQAGFISEALRSIGIEMESFVFVAVEKEPPYALGIYNLDQEAIDYGVNQLNELMTGMARCIEKDTWPSYPILNLSLPSYANFEHPLEIDYD